jgi:glycine dehydrogenase
MPRRDQPRDRGVTTADSEAVAVAEAGPVARGPAAMLHPLDTFARRHLGSGAEDIATMLRTIGVDSVEALVAATVPADIRLERPLAVALAADGHAPGESEVLAELARLASGNRVERSFLGMGYHDCLVPPVIHRNVLENPGWYTQYTPYQAEISQGRLEALLNFQTMISDLTALPVANASLLDEATAVAEALHFCWALHRGDSRTFFVSRDCHPQTIAVVSTRAQGLGVTVRVGDHHGDDFAGAFGVVLQYPTSDGRVEDYRETIARAHAAGALAVVACDLLALTLLVPPGELGADVAVGSAQRFGVPLGFGGPHAAFFATREEWKRQLPGRLIGVSRDAGGRPALRMALQTREQHIRREKATSNICTAQVLLAIMASMYAVYHGPRGLRRIAERVHLLAATLAAGLRQLGYQVGDSHFFDTLRVGTGDQAAATVLAQAEARGINLRLLDDATVGIALDETTSAEEIDALLAVFAADRPTAGAEELAGEVDASLPPALARTTPFLTHPVFQRYHTEHEMLRYIKRLEARDLSLTRAMIPLGSCTMKLNATAEMLPISWPGFARLHPFAPESQSAGYRALFAQLESWLCEITGFAACSLQPNAGSQGEYAGLLSIGAYHRARGEHGRDVCLIPVSAHGTNPASAVMAGMTVVVVACDERGNVDLDDLRRKAEQHAGRLAALMVTYPSTHGVFEEGIREICAIVHRHGGQVYLDGANMNAQVGLCRPGDYGADVCHLNLHKTFCIPHGGGGPGMGPICVAAHLAPFLPRHPLESAAGAPAVGAVGAVAAAPWGSAGILPIPWAYIALMGGDGLRRATELAILNANYMAARLGGAFPVLYTGARGRVAHEFILDLRPFKASAGIEAEDVAKRLMDYGYHAPTMSFPVPGTLMIEPTESESKAELDRFCDAMLAIRAEIQTIADGGWPRTDNPLKNSPHTAEAVTASDWGHPYSREQAAFPLPWVRDSKFWPSVARVDGAGGDRNLVCSCPPIEAYA